MTGVQTCALPICTISASEVQSLYGISSIGSAPTPPTLVQTNRTPTSAETGSKISGSFKVFTPSGIFQTNVALNTNLMTIVLTHGWNSNSDGWPSNMASQFVAGGITANIVAWDWRDDAKQDGLPGAVSKVFPKTPDQGFALGTNLLRVLGAGYSQKIHFIGHSFGTLVNAAAADYLHGEAPKNNPPQHLLPSRTQMTLLDEAELANVGGKFLKISTTTEKIGYIKPLPKSFAWSDNYVSAVGEFQKANNVVNIVLERNRPGVFYSSISNLFDALIVYHGVPCEWYGDTILNPSGSVLGNIWSFERTNNFTTPATGTFWDEQGSGLVLGQINRDYAVYFRDKQMESLEAQVGLYGVLYVINALVKTAGDVTATVVEKSLSDPYQINQTTPATVGISTYSQPAPSVWSPQLVLRTHSPVYAWVPLTIPTNTISMSFDFVLQGDGTDYSFSAALNGTNVFSLALDLIQTNVTLNSGLIDVSQYAGTNVELFLGVVGGSSSNTTVTVSGIRLYSFVPPSLQAQTAGNSLVLTWPLSASDYNLQSTTNFADTNSWTTPPNVPVIVNLQNAVTNPISGAVKFYRLKK